MSWWLCQGLHKITWDKMDSWIPFIGVYGSRCDPCKLLPFFRQVDQDDRGKDRSNMHRFMHIKLYIPLLCHSSWTVKFNIVWLTEETLGSSLLSAHQAAIMASSGLFLDWQKDVGLRGRWKVSFSRESLCWSVATITPFSEHCEGKDCRIN